MKFLLFYSVTLAVALSGFVNEMAIRPVRLFDGKSFKGWEGDTLNTWRIENGAITAGSLQTKQPNNDFLTTKADYGNFILRLKFKLLGTEGFVNGGVQFRSRRHTNPAYEMIGYQADIGGKYWWGSLYDESRRNVVLAQSDTLIIPKLIRQNDWNDYEIRAENRRIRLYLNGRQTVDYTEKDPSVPQTGLIGLQIHGGGKTQIYYKDITIEELP